MVKIIRWMVIVLALLLVAIFLPGCNVSNSIAANANPIVNVSNSGISNIKTTPKVNNVIVENVDCKEQMTKFCNDLRLNYNKNTESNLN